MNLVSVKSSRVVTNEVNYGTLRTMNGMCSAFDYSQPSTNRLDYLTWVSF